MNNKYLSLYELNNLVRGTLEQTFRQRYWMVAELSEVRPAMSGHCYVEFVEKTRAAMLFAPCQRHDMA